MSHAKTQRVVGALALIGVLTFGTTSARAQQMSAGGVAAPRYVYAPGYYGNGGYYYYYPAPATQPYAYTAPRATTARPVTTYPAYYSGTVATNNSANDHVGGQNRDYSRGWRNPLAKPWLKPLR